jgi:hypothetical protein
MLWIVHVVHYILRLFFFRYVFEPELEMLYHRLPVPTLRRLRNMGNTRAFLAQSSLHAGTRPSTSR